MMRRMKRNQMVCMVLVCVMMAVCLGQTAKAAASCKSLCGAVLKVTQNSSQLKYESSAAYDCGALSASDQKKISSIEYVYDEKEVYSICIVEANSKKDAKALSKTFAKYKKANSSSNYLADYSSSEQKVFKNAAYGYKGKCAYYVAMSTSKATNNKGISAIKKKL